MQVRVNVEEILSKTITISVPNGTDDIESYVENKIQEMYESSNGRSILATGDFNGFVQIQLEYDDVTTDYFNPL